MSQPLPDQYSADPEARSQQSWTLTKVRAHIIFAAKTDLVGLQANEPGPHIRSAFENVDAQAATWSKQSQASPWSAISRAVAGDRPEPVLSKEQAEHAAFTQTRDFIRDPGHASLTQWWATGKMKNVNRLYQHPNPQTAADGPGPSQSRFDENLRVPSARPGTPHAADADAGNRQGLTRTKVMNHVIELARTDVFNAWRKDPDNRHIGSAFTYLRAQEAVPAQSGPSTTQSATTEAVVEKKPEPVLSAPEVLRTIKDQARDLVDTTKGTPLTPLWQTGGMDNINKLYRPPETERSGERHGPWRSQSTGSVQQQAHNDSDRNADQANRSRTSLARGSFLHQGSRDDWVPALKHPKLADGPVAAEPIVRWPTVGGSATSSVAGSVDGHSSAGGSSVVHRYGFIPAYRPAPHVVDKGSYPESAVATPLEGSRSSSPVQEAPAGNQPAPGNNGSASANQAYVASWLGRVPRPGSPTPMAGGNPSGHGVDPALRGPGIDGARSPAQQESASPLPPVTSAAARELTSRPAATQPGGPPTDQARQGRTVTNTSSPSSGQIMGR